MFIVMWVAAAVGCACLHSMLAERRERAAMHKRLDQVFGRRIV
jgi:hypothetical protein